MGTFRTQCPGHWKQQPARSIPLALQCTLIGPSAPCLTGTPSHLWPTGLLLCFNRSHAPISVSTEKLRNNARTADPNGLGQEEQALLDICERAASASKHFFYPPGTSLPWLVRPFSYFMEKHTWLPFRAGNESFSLLLEARPTPPTASCTGKGGRSLRRSSSPRWASLPPTSASAL